MMKAKITEVNGLIAQKERSILSYNIGIRESNISLKELDKMNKIFINMKTGIDGDLFIEYREKSENLIIEEKEGFELSIIETKEELKVLKSNLRKLEKIQTEFEKLNVMNLGA